METYYRMDLILSSNTSLYKLSYAYTGLRIGLSVRVTTRSLFTVS
jgi:hypothetical protein